jgi:Subtilisin-like serine proteases
MKRTVLFLLTTVFSLALFAQNVGLGMREYLRTNQKKTSFYVPQNYSLREIDGNQYLSTIIEANEHFDPLAFESLGCKIGAKVGNIYTLYIPQSKVSQVLAQIGIKEIETARKVSKPFMDKAANDVNADLVWQGDSLPQGYSGNGVIIGVTDWGFDYTNPMFYDTTYTNYRVLAAWDQFRKGGTHPQGYLYGAEFVGRDSLLIAKCDTSNIYGYGYHATHVSSIAAGSGAGTKYKGIAQEANLLMCTFLVDESGIIDAYAWMRDKARAAGKRLVINGSWGLYHWGVLDGTSLLDRVIDSLSYQDSIVFVSSAGNCGAYNFHLKAHFDSADTVSSALQFDVDRNVDNYWGQNISMVGDSISGFSSRLEFYNPDLTLADSTPWVSTFNNDIIGDSMLVLNGDTIIYRVTSSTSYGLSGRPSQAWSVRETKYTTSNHYVMLSIAGQNGNVHCWNVAALTTGVGNWGLDFMKYRQTDIGGDHLYGIGEPTIANSMISVAAYTSRKRNSYTGGSIANFSSYGPRIDGQQKPDIAAPGVSVTTTVSSFAPDYASSTTYIDYGGRHYPLAALSGTSMSSPVVSGIVALMLQANPNLTPGQVKDIIHSTAREDEFTSSQLPNTLWGYGKIDALACVRKALVLLSLPQDICVCRNIDVYPVPANNTIYFSLGETPSQIILYNTMGQRVLSQPSSFAQSIDISSLQRGVYVFEVRQKDRVYRTKIIKE